MEYYAVGGSVRDYILDHNDEDTGTDRDFVVVGSSP
jgi:tRNA nucleotidyltransferase/poly(A) polymerase